MSFKLMVVTPRLTLTWNNVVEVHVQDEFPPLVEAKLGSGKGLRVQTGQQDTVVVEEE